MWKRIKLAMDDGFIAWIDADVVGGWAIHAPLSNACSCGKCWRVTHVVSGFALPAVFSKAEAVIARKAAGSLDMGDVKMDDITQLTATCMVEGRALMHKLASRRGCFEEDDE